MKPAILERLRGVQRAGKGWLAFCPAHNDQHKRSLSVGLGEDGRTLLKCHAAGCAVEQIVAAVNMSLADLAPPTGNGHRPERRREVATYDYCDERGKLLYQVVRYEPKDFRCRRPDGNGGSSWNLDGVRLVPYRLPELAEAPRVFSAEGEQDVDTLVSLGLVATCNHGGAGKWREEHTRALVAAAVSEVVVLRDNDAAGASHQAGVAQSCAAGGLALVKVLDLPDLPAKGDVSDYVDAQRAAGRTDDEIRAALLALAEEAPVFDPASEQTTTAADSAPASGPAIITEGDDYRVTWPDAVEFFAVAPRESGEGLHAEVTITLRGDVLSWGRLNLASTSMREGLVKKLGQAAAEVPWRERLELACRLIAQRVRIGSPIVTLAPTMPEPGGRFLVDKLMPISETTVISGDGGAGKGHLALALALALTRDVALPCGLRPIVTPTRVLYLDWESCREEQEERLFLLAAGLSVDPPAVEYRAMTRPLADDIATIRAEVTRRRVGLVIADSAGPAAGGEPEGADSAIRLMTALRSLAPATRLLLAHVSKASAESPGPARPYGSVFISNLARSVWEIRRSAEEESDLLVALYHRKVNRGRLHQPISLRFTFHDDRVTLHGQDIADSGDLLARASLSKRVLTALKTGAATVADLAAGLDSSEDTIGRIVRRLAGKRVVINVAEQVGKGHPSKWGLVHG